MIPTQMKQKYIIPFMKKKTIIDKVSFPLKNNRKVNGETSFMCAINYIFYSVRGLDSQLEKI